MKPGVFQRFVLMAVGLLAAVWPETASACASCFGRSDSPMAHGMNMGILTLLLVIGAVLAGIAAFFAYLMIRSSRMAARRTGTPQGVAAPDSPVTAPLTAKSTL